MKVVIAGGSGLIGRALAWRLATVGQEVIVLTRDASAKGAPGGPRRVEWIPDGSTGPWVNEIAGADAIVNLTGAGMADQRWTDARKQELRDSRVLPTRSLVAAVRQMSSRPAVFLQGSAVGFYGADRSDRELDESFPPGDDYLGRLCVAWEAEAHPIMTLGCRLVIFRSGIVLAREGGVVARMKLPFRMFLGGPVASGRQYVSWIHRDDWVAMAIWALGNPSVVHAINATAPNPVTNATFSETLAHALHRPSWLPAPGLALRAIFGELATEMLVKGQRVLPRRASQLGFTFSHPSLEGAMEEAVGLRT